MDILGHPTGRLLLARPGYPLDMDKVLEVAAEEGVAIEINAEPHRLDLDWRFHAKAIRLGIPLVICPDAHSLEGLGMVRYGTICARKGGCGKEDVLNSLGAEEFLDWVKKRREKKIR